VRDGWRRDLQIDGRLNRTCASWQVAAVQHSRKTARALVICLQPSL
jgi:hypothetical protein